MKPSYIWYYRNGIKLSKVQDGITEGFADIIKFSAIREYHIYVG